VSDRASPAPAYAGLVFASAGRWFNLMPKGPGPGRAQRSHLGPPIAQAPHALRRAGSAFAHPGTARRQPAVKDRRGEDARDRCQVGVDSLRDTHRTADSAHLGNARHPSERALRTPRLRGAADPAVGNNDGASLMGDVLDAERCWPSEPRPVSFSESCIRQDAAADSSASGARRDPASVRLCQGTRHAPWA
jgi:hypothetical protein